MKITLTKIRILNFKGLRDLTIEFSENVMLFGANGSGKTTIADSVLWLLFDKDSQNKKDFEIKTLDATGEPLHNLDHEVEGTFDVDGRKLVLRKVYAEKWVKQRGSVQSTFSGHTTTYYVDGVPTKAKDYKDYIDGLIDEQVFKLLTSPTYFNEQLSWQDRRKTLLDVCGDISDDDVIAGSAELRELPAILEGRSLEGYKKIIAARRTEINKELDKIPVRIDEAERSKPDIGGLSQKDLTSQVEQLRSEVEAKEQEMQRLQNGGEVVEQEKHLRELEGELLEIKNRLQGNIYDSIAAKRNEISDAENTIHDLKARLHRNQTQIDLNNTAIIQCKQKAADLRAKWNTVNAEEPQVHTEDSCPVCGQSLPEEQVAEAHAKALEEFNLKKSQRLEDITNDGKAQMTRVKELEAQSAKLQADSDEWSASLPKLEIQLNEAKEELNGLQASVQDPTKDAAYVAKQDEINKVRNHIASLRQSVLDDVQRVRVELMNVRDELRRKETALASFSQIATADKRIAELNQQQRELSAEYERLEKELYLTEEFMRTKVSMLEEKINSKFKLARFKLFDVQVNGGLQETCVTTYRGVPYGTGLNQAARVNVGLDVIRTLCDHYSIYPMCIIDNRESVTELIDMPTQVISLVVSPEDKQLRVEHQIKGGTSD